MGLEPQSPQGLAGIPRGTLQVSRGDVATCFRGHLGDISTCPTAAQVCVSSALFKACPANAQLSPRRVRAQAWVGCPVSASLQTLPGLGGVAGLLCGLYFLPQVVPKL